MLAVLLSVHPAFAQQPDGPLRVPSIDAPGFATLNDAGEPVSFFADLARAIAGEAGFALDFVEFDTPLEVREAMLGDGADFFAGTGRWVDPEGRLLYAGPVAETNLLLYVREAEAPVDTAELLDRGIRVGTTRDPDAVGIALPEGSAYVFYDDVTSLFAGLVFDEIDAAMLMSSLGERALRTTGLATLVKPAFPALRTQQHWVALDPAFAGLMPDIEAAVARLEADGTIRDIAQRWYMVAPVPAPETLTVGVIHFPPYYVIEEDGSFSGFGVEVLRALADRAGVGLRFEAVSLESWADGPRFGAFDLLPVRSVTEAEREYMDFSAPVQTVSYATFVRQEDADGPVDARDGRVATLFSTPLIAEMEAALGVTLSTVASTEEAAAALQDGEIDALIYPRETFRRHMADEGLGAQFAELPEPLFRNDLAVALRPGLGDLRDRFDTVIRGFLGSAEYREMSRRWFDSPVFWTTARLTTLFSAVGALLLAVATAFLWNTWRARRMAARLRAATEAANARLAAILSSTSQAVFGFDRNGELSIANPRGREMLGLDSLEGPQPWPARACFTDPRTKEPCDIFDDPTGAQGRVCLFEANDDDPPRFVRATVDAVEAPGTGLASLLILEDDHENEINRQKLERSERLSALGLLTGGLAHDFNNLLGTIRLNAEVGSMKAPDASGEFFARIVEAVESGRRLIDRLLAFSGQAPKAPVVIDVGRSLERLRDLSGPAVTEAIAFDVTPPDAPAFVFCDDGELEAALLNLVLNARNAILSSGRGDRISVQVRRRDDGPLSDTTERRGPIIEFCVTDNGSGMTEEVKRRALDPFFTTRQDEGGTGLGLPMVAGFVRRAGGKLSIYSEPETGTTVRLLLPAMTGDGVPKPGPSDELRWGQGQTILVVEDKEHLRTLTVDALKHLGYDANGVAAGAEALDALARRDDYALVLSDIVMPGGMSGLELARTIADLHGDMPVILMTGFADTGAREIETSGLQVLRKPVALSELANAVAAEIDV